MLKQKKNLNFNIKIVMRKTQAFQEMYKRAMENST